jgi:hypothetical protein
MRLPMALPAVPVNACCAVVRPNNRYDSKSRLVKNWSPVLTGLGVSMYVHRQALDHRSFDEEDLARHYPRPHQ